jgi:cold shock CspA family protein
MAGLAGRIVKTIATADGTVDAMSKAQDKSKAIRGSARLPVGNAPKELTVTPTRGRISRIAHGRGHGYIRVNGDREVFFHRSDTEEDLFNQLDVDADVRFELVEDRLSGARAIRVRRPRQKKGGA